MSALSGAMRGARRRSGRPGGGWVMGVPGKTTWAVSRAAALIHRLAAQREQRARLAEVLGMADKQQAPGLEHPVDAREHPLLRRRVEINHHIAAKDHVERLRERPVIVDQVQADEVDVLAQFGLDPHHPGVATLAAKKEPLQTLGAKPLQAIEPIHPLPPPPSKPRSRYTPCAAMASTRESISLATSVKAAWAPRVSSTVIAIE